MVSQAELILRVITPVENNYSDFGDKSLKHNFLTPTTQLYAYFSLVSSFCFLFNCGLSLIIVIMKNVDLGVKGQVPL